MPWILKSKLKANRYRTAVDLAILAALIAMAVALRLPALHFGLWRDEGHVVYIAQSSSLPEFFARLKSCEISPPLFFALMKAFIATFGLDEITLKIPVFICGLILIPAVFLLIRQFGSRNEAIAGAIVASLAPSAVYFSQEMRTYVLSALLVTAAAIMFCRTLARPSPLRKALFVLAGTAAIYSHYMTILTILGFLAAFMWLRGKEGIGLATDAALRLFGLILVLCVPLTPLAVPQMMVGNPSAGPGPSILSYGLIFISNFAYFLIPLTLKPYSTAENLTVAVVLVALAYAFRRTTCTPASHKRTGTSSLSRHSAYVVLLSAGLPSILTNGYLTLHYGLERYMFPVEPLGWSLLVIAVSDGLSFFLGANFGTGASAAGRHLKMASTILLLIALLAFDQDYGLTLGMQVKSGLKTLSLDVHRGRYPQTAFVVAPDYDNPTFSYYMHANAPELPTNALHSIARWSDLSPYDQKSFPESWRRPALVGEAEKNMLHLFKEGFRHVAYIVDLNPANHAVAPCWEKMTELFIRLGADCHLQEKTYYRGLQESYRLYLFGPKEAATSVPSLVNRSSEGSGSRN